MMQKTVIPAAEAMLLDQEDTKAANEVANVLAAEAYSSQIQDLERAISKLCSTAYAKDEELTSAYNRVIHFKKVVDRLEPQVLKLQGVLKMNKSLKKEVDEL